MKIIVFPFLLAFLAAGSGACAQNLTGEWTGAIFFANLNAELETSFTIQQEEQQVEGHSTRNASKRILGGFKGGLVKIFAKKTFEKGALLHIRKGSVEGDSIKAVLSTIFGSTYWFRGQILGDTLLKGVLLDGRLRPQGGFILKRVFFAGCGLWKITENLFDLTREKFTSGRPASKNLSRLLRKNSDPFPESWWTTRIFLPRFTT
ncbi:MAG: hypothetical protein IPJ00_05205 [Saprospirales bacterium]|nr:hypothetical protein [Saprospirales bacterium]